MDSCRPGGRPLPGEVPGEAAGWRLQPDYGWIPEKRMHGKTCLITGANSGIGKATAIRLARLGAHVVMVCRDRGRGEAAQVEIRRESGNDAVDLLIADLSSQRQIRDLAATCERSYGRLDVLLNNAGLIIGERRLTEDGIEMTFALNHLGYFLLTCLLLDPLKAAAPARIVNVSSDGHRSGTIDFDDLGGAKRYSAVRAYCQSKLANVLFTAELARRLEGGGVSANAVHPGFVGTNFGASGPGWLRLGLRIAQPFRISAERGAETLVYLASSPEVEGVSGKYFVKCQPVEPSREARDEAIARRLWEVSERMVGTGA